MPRGSKPGERRGGRKPGVPNKLTGQLKDAILEAARLAGGGDKDGLTSYLRTQACANPGPFMGLLGKVLPLQVAGDQDNPLSLAIIERVIVRSHNQDG